MDRNAFGRLCYLLEHSSGLSSTKHVTVVEQVAMFLSVIAHHKKNCIVKHDFLRSGRTLSKHFFNVVLNTVYKMSHVFLAKAAPITDYCSDPRWRWFKEGSAADSRVLRDAIHRPHGLRVPSGNYCLCDNDYTNFDEFLTPYRGVRYHLNEWDQGQGGPQSPRELFNLKHSATRNVIERVFGLLKVRWGILRIQSFYPIDTQNKIILACCLLHNFLRNKMLDDPLKLEIPDQAESYADANVKYISSIDTTTAWTNWRDQLASSMYNEWQNRPGCYIPFNTSTSVPAVGMLLLSNLLTALMYSVVLSYIVSCILFRTNWCKAIIHIANEAQAEDEGCSRQIGRKGNKERSETRRTWTIMQEEALINAMKSRIVGGWKCDNGFRNCYLAQLEAHMQRSFPHSNIKAEPHITSKLHV
ncbi:hypothetical protein Sango_0667100 [Sesamum angolense]|uniref:DDE Tnp4 domain-containing protein n=1 Tax=Sesamum angolense TaxID=2727404 RepID=A0AAE1X7P3_9LAMI|nr:hypothetical protein Sango_0667100 [Sesamum angolense]